MIKKENSVNFSLSEGTTCEHASPARLDFYIFYLLTFFSSSKYMTEAVWKGSDRREQNSSNRRPRKTRWNRWKWRWGSRTARINRLLNELVCPTFCFPSMFSLLKTQIESILSKQQWNKQILNYQFAFKIWEVWGIRNHYTY